MMISVPKSSQTLRPNTLLKDGDIPTLFCSAHLLPRTCDAVMVKIGIEEEMHIFWGNRGAEVKEHEWGHAVLIPACVGDQRECGPALLKVG